MKKQYLFYLPLLILSAFVLTGCTNKDEVPSNISIVDSISQEEEEEESKDVPVSGNSELGYLSDSSEFTKKKQSVGSVSELEYTLSLIEDVKSNGYHSFNFEISTSSQEPVLPFVELDYVADRGVVRVRISGVVKDDSGIPYQKSRDTNLGAITGIYRAVTSLPKTSIYEIGVQGENPFKLEYEQRDENAWVVRVKVAYDLKYTPPSMDFGSTEFGSDIQKIEGMTASDGARISSYSYNVSGGILKFVFSVASGASNPIPSVEAKYDDQNILEVRFPSLTSDKVSTWGSSIALPSGLVVNVSRGSESSVYRFGGIGGPKPFKLSATQSPNQVIIEIKTN